MNLGLCHQWPGDADRAAADLEKAVALGPCDIRVANTLAWNLISRRKYARAREVVRRSLEWKWWDNWEARAYEAKLKDLP